MIRITLIPGAAETEEADAPGFSVVVPAASLDGVHGGTGSTHRVYFRPPQTGVPVYTSGDGQTGVAY